MEHRILFLIAIVAIAWLRPAVGHAAQQEAGLREPQLLASAWIGTPYKYGGKSPETGFDCSGLVAHVFERTRGISLPPNAAAQSRFGLPVKRAALSPGDLLFYNTRNRPYSHVGIYLGDGRFIHAPRPGQRVRVESVDSPYWRARFNGARRIEHSGA